MNINEYINMIEKECRICRCEINYVSKREDERVFDEDILGKTLSKKNYCAQFREMKSS